MFPVTDSNLCASALIERVLSQYDLGSVGRCRLHQRGLNDTYKVECGEDHTYFLRIYCANWRSREEIETEIAILLHLAQHQVNVSIPVSRTDAQVLTPLDCAEGRRWGVLFTSAPGKEVDREASYTDELAAAYGEGAAAIHSAADSFKGRPLRPALDLAELLERPLHLVTPAIAHRPEDVAYIGGLGDRLRRRIEGTAGLKTGFCHGDLHGWNACQRDGSFTFYDFDCCGWGYRAYDLATFPWAFAIRETTAERIEAMGRAFLKGYVRRRELAAVDVDAVPVFVAIRQIWLIGLHVSLGDRFAWGWINDGYFDRQLKVLRDWEKDWLNRPGAEWLQAGGD
jgi:Ser/Thr protein kinase RdoA (MazF antagonist)